jgi:hypothetical protein
MTKRSTAYWTQDSSTSPLRDCTARRLTQARLAIAASVLPAAVGTSLPAHAVDGCRVMLCLAAPSWREIPQCVPTIHQLHRDLARGKRFPTCKDAGTGNSTHHAWANAPDNCPRQYTHAMEREAGFEYVCDYSGAITVKIAGAMFTRTWWSLSGGTVTEFSPAAKAQLGRWDARFDNDFAAWLASQRRRPVQDPA